MSFQTNYHKYVFDICPHCNLYQKTFNHVKVTEISDEVVYIYNCRHCYKMYSFKMKREVLTNLNRSIDDGFNGCILPEYAE